MSAIGGDAGGSRRPWWRVNAQPLPPPPRPHRDAPSLGLLHHHYTKVRADPALLALCGVEAPDTPYSRTIDDDLTVIINGWARPTALSLVWEAIQYQTRRPRETWIIQSDPGDKAEVPRAFLANARRFDTRVIDSDLDHGCWFRFCLAALQCRTRYVALYDDDTVPGRRALESALADIARTPGVYGAYGMTLLRVDGGPRYWQRALSGWPAPTEHPVAVDLSGQMWLLETRWLKEMLKHLPDRLLDSPRPARECGEEMCVSFAAQRLGLRTFAFAQGTGRNERLASLDPELGFTPQAMSLSGGLDHVDDYLRHFVERGWQLLNYRLD